MRGWWIVAIVPLAAVACAAPAPQPARPDPVQVCTNQLTYWAGEQLRGAPDQGYDYQHMGLTSDQNDALDAVVAAARRDGPGVVDGLVRDACTRLSAGPVNGPWGY